MHTRIKIGRDKDAMVDLESFGKDFPGAEKIISVILYKKGNEKTGWKDCHWQEDLNIGELLVAGFYVVEEGKRILSFLTEETAREYLSKASGEAQIHEPLESQNAKLRKEIGDLVKIRKATCDFLLGILEEGEPASV